MKKEWKKIAEANGITGIFDKLSEELDELKEEVEKCRRSNFPLRENFDPLVSELADVEACIQQLVFWGRLHKPMKAMMRYKAARQLWRWEDDGNPSGM